jgi:hypothetical protein
MINRLFSLHLETAHLKLNRHYKYQFMRKVYLHIGFGKTGSSSLQSYLSFNPEFQNPEKNEKLLYCCILEDGKIIFGDELKKCAERSPLKYFASAPGIAKVEILPMLKSELDRLFEAGYTPIFSHESWSKRTGEFHNSNFFNNLDITADVIVYIRPQVDWFNSAWWQWFAWEKSFKTPQDVIDAWGYNFMLWGNQISQWNSLEGVEKITVRLQPTDIIDDFLGLFKQAPVHDMSEKYRVNTSLPPILIKFLLKYYFIRSVHGAYVDAILSKNLKFEGKSPWIIDIELADQIITATRLDNEKLLGMLDEASQEIMKKDSRWWDAGYYRKRHVFNEKDLELSRNELYSIIGQAFRTLIKFGK